MKNPGFDKIHKISKVLRGSEDDFEGEDPNLIAIKANAPVVTCDVERTFSLLKDVNSAKRWNLTEEHIKEIMMIHGIIKCMHVVMNSEIRLCTQSINQSIYLRLDP